jgi:hypothetical protein
MKTSSILRKGWLISTVDVGHKLECGPELPGRLFETSQSRAEIQFPPYFEVVNYAISPAFIEIKPYSPPCARQLFASLSDR